MTHEEVADIWDLFHPADSGEEEEFRENGDYSDLDEVPLIPTIDRLPDVVDYSTRGPNDFVISGPTGGAMGNGRRFPSLTGAYKWAVAKYGEKRVQLIPQESEYKWALLIKAA